ncbi:6304_t:CDS:2, partial [Scutellospora calospora]
TSAATDFARFNKTRVHYIEKGLHHIFKILQEFVNRNANNVGVYIRTYRNQNAYIM